MILCFPQTQPRHTSLFPDQRDQAGRPFHLLRPGRGQGRRGRHSPLPAQAHGGRGIALCSRSETAPVPGLPSARFPGPGAVMGLLHPGSASARPGGPGNLRAGERHELAREGTRGGFAHGRAALTRNGPGRRLRGEERPRPSAPRLPPALPVPRGVYLPRPGPALLTRGARPAPPSASVAGC